MVAGHKQALADFLSQALPAGARVPRFFQVESSQSFQERPASPNETTTEIELKTYG